MDLAIVGVKRQEAELASRRIEEDFKSMWQSWGAPGAAPLARVNELLPGGKPFAAPPCILPLVRKSQELATASGQRGPGQPFCPDHRARGPGGADGYQRRHADHRPRSPPGPGPGRQSPFLPGQR